MRSQTVGEGPRIVEDAADRLGDDLRNGLGVPVREEVRGDPGRLGDREAMQPDPLSVRQVSDVYADVRAAGSACARHGELVSVGREMAQPIDGRRRPMGDDTLIGRPVPCRNVGSKLEPGGSQVKVVRDRGGGEPVHARRYPFQRAPGAVRRSRVVDPIPAAWICRRVTRPHCSWASSWRRGRGRILAWLQYTPNKGVNEVRK